MNNRKVKPEILLPEEEEFELRCVVEQADQLQADLLGAYGDMLYDRQRVKRQTVILTAGLLLFSLLILLSKVIVDEYLWFTGFFLLLVLGYGIYFDRRGYKNDFIRFQKYLEECMEREKPIYETQDLRFEFKGDRVYFRNDRNVTRFFYYTDIRYFEQTDRFYIFGMKYLPRETRLYDMERVLFTKRSLSEEDERKLLELMDRVRETYQIEPVLESNPFL